MGTAATAPLPTPETPLVESDWTTLSNSRSYHFVTAGPEQAPALVFLHGYTDSWRSGELLFPHLAGDFRIFALDQRGHGQTDNDFDRFTIADFAADAADFIRHVVRRPVVLVGHSLGSLVAQRVAAEHRDLVTRLVLISSAETSAGNPALLELREALEALGDTIPRQFAWDFQASTALRPLPPGQLDVFIQESLRLRPATWRRTADGLLGDNRVVAGQIGVPTLVLWGDGDGVFSAASQQRLKALLRKGTLITYPGVGHAPNWEIPEIVADDILAFAKA